MTSVIGDDFKDMASLVSGSLKDETAQKANIMRSIKEIMATRLQYVKESKREDLEKRAAELSISSFSLTGLKDEYQNFLLRVIGVTETWERKAELLPVMIDSLLEQGLKDGMLARSGQAEMNALVYAAYIGDIKAIERAKSLLGDKLPEQLNQGKLLPLGVALLQGQYEYAKVLIAAGADVNARDDRYECLLHYVIRGKKPEIVEFLLQQDGLDVSAKDEYDHTSLHHAALMKDAQIVALLLKNNEIAAQKQERDIFGRTPLDIALQEKSDDVIRLLIDDPTVDIQTLPGYGIAPVKINQGHILDKLTERLALKKKQMEEQKSETTLLDPKEILIPGGHCNGLSLLMEYYSFKGKEEEFYSVMELFSTWDGTEESLKSTKGLSELSGDYKDLNDLMEQWTNDIIWFQQNYDVHFRQEERVPQLEMVRKSPLDKVTPATAIFHTFTQEQLAEWLQIRSYFPGTIIEFKGSGHNTTLKILPQSKGAYY
ncbi:MAG: ankyrin repeat domain-containing protein, partial [Rhabdochlamydiaceae bacterium]